jgi:hypothetical protein
MVFMSQAGAPAWPPAGMLWVIWVIGFMLTQMTQKLAPDMLWVFGSLGHLGHFVIE